MEWNAEKDDVSISYGRRMMISMITFLLPFPKLMQHFDANANANASATAAG